MPPNSLCVCMCKLLSNASVNTFPRQRGIVGDVVFSAVRVVAMESLWVCLCIPLSLLRNGSVNTFPRRREIDGGLVFYAVRVVSMESLWVCMCKLLSNASVNTFRGNEELLEALFSMRPV
jgi:hypothetical protein